MSDHEQLADWSESLSSEDEGERGAAAAEALKALVDPKFKDKRAALTLLQQSWWPLTPGLIPQAVPAVLSASRGLDLDAHELEDAALLLGNLCRDDPSQLPHLEKALIDESSSAVRKAAAGAVGRVGEAAIATLPALIKCLTAKEDEVGSAALESLGAMGTMAPQAVGPALLSDVERSTGARRYLGLAGLRGLLEEQFRSGHATSGMDSLERIAVVALSDSEPAVRLEAVALVGMSQPGSPTGVSALRSCLADASPDVSAYAAVGLLRRGQETESAVATLRALMMSPDPERNGAALTVLDGLETTTLKRARAVLEDAAKDGPQNVQSLAKELLGLLDVQQLRRVRPG